MLRATFTEPALKQLLDAQAQELRTLKTTVASLQGEIAALRSADEAPPQQVATSSASSARRAILARAFGWASRDSGDVRGRRRGVREAKS